MHLGTTTYSKRFHSAKKEGEDQEFYQERNPNDLVVISSLIKNYSSSQNTPNFREERFKGFDRRFQYKFSFGVKNPNRKAENEHIYQSCVFVTKMGAEEDRSKTSDIENELIQCGFNQES